MRRKQAFRPSGMDALEDRVLLSAAGRFLGSQLDSLKQTAGRAIERLEERVAPADAPLVAVVGDDLAGEYVGDLPARNWVEMLAATGRINAGPYSRTDPGDARGTGFTLNWARRGADTADVLADQLPGVTAQVATGKVAYVVLQMGSNDFAEFLASDALAQYKRPGILVERLNAVQHEATGRFDQAFWSVMRANPDVRVVVTTIPDITRLPGVRARWARAGDLGNRVLQTVSRSISVYNAQIRTYARGNPRVALADVGRQLEPRLRGTGMLRLGDTSIDLAAQGNDYRHFFLADGVRPGTAGQGLIANSIVGALNGKFQAGIRPLGAADIVGIAERAQELG